MAGGFAQKKRQYLEANMHYITHNAVIPPVDGKVSQSTSARLELASSPAAINTLLEISGKAVLRN
jgi:hypothetical protein